MSEIFSTVLSVDQLAHVLHKSAASIRSDASRNPSALPPICRLPGNKRLLFRVEDVQSWMAKYVQRSPADLSPTPPVPAFQAAAKRGRPRKTAIGAA